MEEFFGMRRSHLSAILVTIVDCMYDLCMKYFTNPILFKQKMNLFSKKYQKMDYSLTCGVSLMEHFVKLVVLVSFKNRHILDIRDVMV